MKKLLLSAALVVATLTTVSAQDLGWKFGPKIGVNAAMLVGNKDLNTGVRSGLVTGGFAEIRCAKWLGVSAELLYSQQGNEWTDKNDLIEAKSTIKLDYLNTPILANFYLTKGFALKAGIQPGFLINAKNKVVIKDGITTEYDNKEHVKPVDFSIPVGLSYDFECGLVLDLRYNIGVSKIYKEIEDTNLNINNGVVQFTAGWKF
ncbi:MAG: porin family protein, partial [Phocaeicola sp.]